MDSLELKVILDKHRLWLDDDEGGERADLSFADLSFADLHSADLSFANLRSANLHSADLSFADLNSANLRSANLHSADLSFADLSESPCNNAIGNMAEIKTLLLEIWPVTYTAEYLHIGCERHLIDEWWAFDDERIERMDSEAFAFWHKWKSFIQQAIELSPATPTERKENG